MRYFRARHLATMHHSQLISDGCVVIDGNRVAAIGTKANINPPRIDEEFDGLLMPGLVNAHTHLELTNVPRPEHPGTFQDWILTTMASMREADEATFKRKRIEAVHMGIAQCLKFGVTCVGDVSQNVDIVRPILAASPLRSISYGECLGLGERQPRFESLLNSALAGDNVPHRTRFGVSPHAPYTVDRLGYVRTFDAHLLRPETDWTTHIAETPDEAAFIHDRQGPFQELYERLGFNPGDGEPGNSSPLAWLFDAIEDAPMATLVHVNYCSDNDLDLIVASQASVAWCPRTHAYFKHPPHRWRDMLARGIKVSIATDSCASSADLNIVDDLRLLHREHPDVEPFELWKMVTGNPSFEFDHSLGICVGNIDDDCYADFVAWPTVSSDPLREILDTPTMLPAGVWTSGERVI